MTTILVRYAEIGLKGKNRWVFEKQLMANIKRVLISGKINVRKESSQIIISLPNTLINQSKEELRKVFGIAWFAEAIEGVSELDEIVKRAVQLAKRLIKKGDTFAIRASRADKRFPIKSPDLENQVGKAVKLTTKAKVDLGKPDKTIFISVNKDLAYMYDEKISGLGGLPVGTSGKVLSLISGGFDSIASSFLLAKRGAEVDLLHFHVFPQAKSVEKTKIKTIWKKLGRYTLSRKIFLASYLPFQMAVLDLNERQMRQELVVFRRLMVRIGEELAKKYNYQALVLGDSLGQVASQTMENIVAVESAVEIPIFRPLIGLDKIEIINLVRQIGLESEAKQKYKDCCSIAATHPATKANLNKIEQLEKRLKIEKIEGAILKSVALQLLCPSHSE